MADAGDWLDLGTLTAPWGLRGEIKFRFEADPAYVEQIKRVYLGDERRPLNVNGFFRRGRAYTLKLQGINSVEEAETLRGLAVSLPRTEAPPLSQGTFFVEDLLGLRVVTTGGREIGTIADVLTTGANDVYIVRGAEGEVLIPAIRDVVVAIDLGTGVVRIEPMPGLLD